jgi:hypothetical protein
MTKQSFIIIAALAFVFGIGTVTASAQGQVLKADIPFEFTVGKKTLPAGEYLVKLPETAGAQVVSFRKADGEGFGMTLTNQVSSKGAEVANGLVFVKSGDRYFLYQVHNGREIGQQVVKSSKISGEVLARQTVALKPAKS